MGLRETDLGCVEWIQLAQYRDRWRASVTVIFPKPRLLLEMY
jgi:hypothetical protein